MTYNIQTTQLERLWKAKTVRKGPNDARHIVWAICECFSFAFYDDNSCLLQMYASHCHLPNYLWVLCPHCLFPLAALNFLTRLSNAVTACELYRICMQ